jgi:methyl farnesoate epoxidase/farnesoate epoxidase
MLNAGLLASEGPGWAEQRRFALRNLRDLGFGKKSMEELIQEDVVEFIESLKSECGKPVYIQKHLNLVVLNTLWKIVGGESFGHCDQKLVNIFETFNT